MNFSIWDCERPLASFPKAYLAIVGTSAYDLKISSNCLTITDSELPEEITAFISATSFSTKTSASLAVAAQAKVEEDNAANNVEEKTKLRRSIKPLVIHFLVWV